jgi:D-alanine-D-alanine ligase
MQPKKKVGILLGGSSHEKETSLDSGRNVFYKLSPEKYEPLALFLDDNLELYQIDQRLLVRNSTKEIVLGLTQDMKVAWNDLPTLVDFVFIALHGGVGENGSVQGALEMLNIPYNGSSVLASSLCMDKYKTAHFLKSQGFDVPQQYLLDAKKWKEDRHNQLALLKADSFDKGKALIVKPHDDGCSVLVAKAKTDAELSAALDAIFEDGKEYALVEHFIEGMELTVGVLGNTKAQALPPSQAISAGDILSIEEKFLPGAGENQTPAPLSKQATTFVQKTIEDVYLALHCKGYARIDCFYQTEKESPTEQERLVILEVNTLPGLTPATCIFHQAAEIGLKPMEFIDLIVELGYEEYSRRGTVVSTISHSSTSIPMSPPALEKV